MTLKFGQEQSEAQAVIHIHLSVGEHMKKSLAAAAALAVALTGFAGMSQAQAATGPTFTYGVVQDLPTFEVRNGVLGNSQPFYQAVFDTLIIANPDGSLAPGLATSWSWDKAHRVMTLKLRQGVKFTNGEAFNAKAVVRNLLQFKKGNSVDAGTAASINAVKAKDAYTVAISLKDAQPDFEMHLTTLMGMMQAPSTLNAASAKTDPIGTGPYVFDKSASTFGSNYVFKANPTWWNKANRKFSGLTIKVLSDATAAVNALKAGQVDVMNLVDMSAIPALKAVGVTVRKVSTTWLGLTFVDKGGRMGTPLKNVKVRQAINYALDRAGMGKIMTGDDVQVTSTPWPESGKGYVPSLVKYYPYDLAKAKQLMKEAGYENGFTLSMPALFAFGATSYTVVQESLAAINIKVDYTDVSFPDFFPSLLAPKFPAYLMPLERNPNDWTFIKFLLARDATWNPSGYGDATSDDLIAKIQNSSGAAQVGYLKQLNTYIVKQAWFAPFFNGEGGIAYSSKVKIPNKGVDLPAINFITPA